MIITLIKKKAILKEFKQLIPWWTSPCGPIYVHKEFIEKKTKKTKDCTPVIRGLIYLVYKVMKAYRTLKIFEHLRICLIQILLNVTDTALVGFKKVFFFYLEYTGCVLNQLETWCDLRWKAFEYSVPLL